jgi:hypothetical protein
MSTLRVNTIQNSGGTGSPAISGLAAALVNFNGQGTVAIRASNNVTSITDHGTGQYTVNFTNAMADANYITVGSAGTPLVANGYIATPTDVNPATSSIRFVTYNIAGSTYDHLYVNVAVFR